MSTEYIKVAESEEDESMEVPCEADNTVYVNNFSFSFYKFFCRFLCFGVSNSFSCVTPSWQSVNDADIRLSRSMWSQVQK